MTGFASGALTFSRVTIAGLEDLGYTVDYAQAETYTSANMGSSCLCNAATRGLGELVNGAVRPFPNEEDVENVEPKNRRRLSDEGRNAAMAFGTSILESRTEQRSGIKFNLLNSDGDNGACIGDKVISVLYLEDGKYFDVLVTNF